MKSLTAVLESAVTPLYESLLDDFDDMEAKLDVTALQSQIIKFILDNYYTWPNCLEITGPDENGLCYVSCKKRDVTLEIRNKNVTSLTNGMFVWDKVYGNFICQDCPNLTSLEGAPKEVMMDFDCNFCDKLKSLKGAPKKVYGDFYCGQEFSTKDVKKVSYVKGRICGKITH